jgi:hypothetical protein
MKMKKPTLRFKHMNRQSRLQSARVWLKEYDGKKENIAKNYRKRYGVGWECAFKELEFLGVKLDPQYVNTVLQNLENQNATKKRRKAEDLEDFRVELFGQDEHYAFIAGFTPGGVPYGITWDEWGEIDDSEDS